MNLKMCQIINKYIDLLNPLNTISIINYKAHAYFYFIVFKKRIYISIGNTQ